MKNKHLLVYRFSAMGDVALTVPVIKSVLEQHPNLEITFVTRKFFVPFFYGIERLNVVGVNLDDYKGVKGLRKLYKKLNKGKRIDFVCDLHDVLRTNILNAMFRIWGKKVHKIKKARGEKKRMIASKAIETPLKHTTERYLDVFRAAGLDVNLSKGPWMTPNPEFYPKSFFEKNSLNNKNEKWTGIAPFAMHDTKIWGVDKVEELIAGLLKENNKVFLFGGGKNELERLEQLKVKFPNIVVASKELSFKEELVFMPHLDVMVTMDSSNMHIASLLGVKVISIWGSTHPSLGFSPLGNEKNIIQVADNKLSCKPCSVYGNIPCSRGDHACMKWISAEEVLERIVNSEL